MARQKKAATAGGGAKKQAFAGLTDILTETDVSWECIMKRFARYERTYGFARIETPIAEEARVFEQYYGESAEALESLARVEIAGKALALRPALLPGVLRAYAQSKTFETRGVSKWSYAGNTLRLGTQSALESDYEFGFEVFGAFTHLTEAQVVGAVWQFIASLGIEDAVLEINSIGTPECQLAYSDTLKDFLKSKKYDLCDECTDRMVRRPLDVFRCEKLDCQTVISEAPVILDYLDEPSRKHFTNILEALEELQVPYQLNPLHAGPGGTHGTSCMLVYKHKGHSVVIGEGAYHEGLMERVSGKKLCSFGFFGSLSRIKEVMDLAKIEVQKEQKSEVFLVPLGELAAKKSLRLFRDLIAAKVSVYDHFGHVGVKNQLKAAETYKSPIALIMGQKEALDEMVILRDVKSGMQEMFSYDKIVDEVKKRLGK